MLSNVDDLLQSLYFANRVITPKPWGHEHELRTETFQLKLIYIDGGKRTSLQYHQRKHEVIWVMAGTGYVEYHPNGGDVKRYSYAEGGRVLIPPNTIHRAVGPLTLLEVTTLYPDDVVRVEDDHGRAWEQLTLMVPPSS